MKNTIKKYFDFRSGILAALMMGSIVWWINAGHGPLLATTAALRQAGYTFIMGGMIIRLCHYFTDRPTDRPWPNRIAIIVATLLPTLVTTGATFFVHSLKGTPEPMWSTIPVAIISPPIFFILSWKQRNAALQVR